VSQQWQLLSVTGSIPPNGVSHSAVIDPVSTELIIYGGSQANLAPLSDTWILSNINPSPGTWTKVAVSGAPGRWAHGAAYDAANKRMMIFGGVDPNEPGGRSSDTWVLSNVDGKTGAPAWTQVAPAGSGPSGRRYFNASYDPNSNRLIIFGGENQTL